MKVYDMTFAVFNFFWALLLLIVKCVEIYVYDNTGDELTLVLCRLINQIILIKNFLLTIIV